MNKKTYIGISGVARSGKNLLANLIHRQLKASFNLNSIQFSLANQLKRDCQAFVSEKLSIDIFTENTEQKKMFRDMLTWYADIKRKQTYGRYWTEKLDQTISSTNLNDIDVVIITDIRFNEYEKDELYWLKEEKKGILIHVNKYWYDYEKNSDSHCVFKKIFMEPANKYEIENNPKVKEHSDFIIDWEDIIYKKENVDPDKLLNNLYLNSVVSECLDKVTKHKNFILK
jgi:hypothetical protein